MSIPTLPAPPDTATVHRLATALNRCFETFTADDDTFAADAFFDLLPPFWRFQLPGRRPSSPNFGRSRAAPRPPASCGSSRPCPDSFWSTRRPRRTRWRAAPPVRGARRGITDVLLYCNGEWDAALRARHAAEAPMLRRDQPVAQS